MFIITPLQNAKLKDERIALTPGILSSIALVFPPGPQSPWITVLLLKLFIFRFDYDDYDVQSKNVSCRKGEIVRITTLIYKNFLNFVYFDVAVSWDDVLDLDQSRIHKRSGFLAIVNFWAALQSDFGQNRQSRISDSFKTGGDGQLLKAPGKSSSSSTTQPSWCSYFDPDPDHDDHTLIRIIIHTLIWPANIPMAPGLITGTNLLRYPPSNLEMLMMNILQVTCRGWWWWRW